MKILACLSHLSLSGGGCGVALGKRLGNEDDGHGAGPLVGLGGIVRHLPDCGPVNDVGENRTVEPLSDPALAAGAHAALDRPEEFLFEGEEEVAVELLAPFRMDPLHCLQQIAPRPLAGSTG